MDTAIILVSGGLDSCVTAAIAAEDHATAFLHVNYGQRTEARELRAFNELADHFGAARRMAVSLEHLASIGGSSLTDPAMEVTAPDLDREEIPTSYVPFRNANLLGIAVSWAEVIGASRIFVGAVEEDSSGYPDCRPEFYRAYNRVIEAGTKPDTRIEIVTPIIDKSKEQIVRLGAERSAPFHLTWSCYQAEEKACGVCDSCALRLRGFQRAGIEDPLPYDQRPDYA